MKKESISFLIDKNIREAYVDGLSHACVVSMLNNKISNLKKVLNRDRPDIKIDELLHIKDWSIIEPIRARYTVFYVQHSSKRIEDVNWIEKNKNKFTNLSNSQIFNLVKLKEKLSVEVPFK